MTLATTEYHGVFIISVNKTRIDAACCLEFKDQFLKLVPNGQDRIILNLNGVGFVDSSGLGAIVGLMKLLTPNTKLDLCGMGETVRKVFALTRMDQVFHIYEGVNDALPEAAD